MALKFVVPEKVDINSKAVYERHVKAFLDLLVLALLEDKPRCGYDILAIIHRKFNVLLSPGTLYPLLYALEKRGFIEGQVQNRRRNYAISKKGSNMVKRLSRDFKDSSLTLLSVMGGDSSLDQVYLSDENPATKHIKT